LIQAIERQTREAEYVDKAQANVSAGGGTVDQPMHEVGMMSFIEEAKASGVKIRPYPTRQKQTTEIDDGNRSR
jgi:hypothetical protein